jgi:hypothetical protein
VIFKRMAYHVPDCRVMYDGSQVLGAIKDAFPSYEVRSMRCSEFSVAQQVAAFSQAKAVFGAEASSPPLFVAVQDGSCFVTMQGACLTNSFFMEKGTVVINFTPAESKYGAFQSVCGTATPCIHRCPGNVVTAG